MVRTSTIARPLTLEEFLRLPERKPALEYEAGEVTRKVSPKARHATLQFELAKRFDLPGFWAGPEARVTFAGHSYVPDVAVVRRDRLPVTPDGEVENELFLAPDVAVEILSPKQSVSRLHRRCLWYVANGVRAALFVDDQDRSVFVFRPDAAPRVVRGDEPIDLADVVPGFRLTAQELFDSLKVR